MEDEALAIYDETRKTKGPVKESPKDTNATVQDSSNLNNTQETQEMLVDQEKEAEVIEMNELPPVQLQLPA